VDSKELTADQLDDLIAHVAPARDYVARLRARMTAQMFPDADALVVLTRRADDALESLGLELRTLYEKVALPEWAGGQVARVPKPRSRRVRPRY
jgi:hypothetical protein